MKRPTFTLDELNQNGKAVNDAACSDTGCDILKDDGTVAFHLWIPNKPICQTHRSGVGCELEPFGDDFKCMSCDTRYRKIT